MIHPATTRRGFLRTGLAGLALAGHSSFAAADERPPVTDPRATSGDDRYEPDWDERLTVTVGPKQADLVGSTDKVIQAAVDYVARIGGGTVQLLAGAYTLRAAVRLGQKVRLRGSGADTVLTKAACVATKLAADSDWYDQEITLEQPGGFQLGDDVCLRAKNHDGGLTVLKRKLVARSGNRFKLDRPLRKNLWLKRDATAATLFPILTGEEIDDVVIEDLVLDGNRANNENLNGNYAGCVFLQDSNRWTLRRVEARNYNGDGVSWQICHDVVVEDCHSHSHAGLGLHPGSGSQRTVIRRNQLEKNRLGLFFCWGVKYGLAEENRIDANGTYGISIGHCDTDNVIRNNVITGSGQVGILFRDDARGEDFWPHRNRVEGNQVIDSGGEEGVAVDVRGRTRDVVIHGNQLRETRGPMKRVAVRLGPETSGVKVSENRIEGFHAEVVDQRRGE